MRRGEYHSFERNRVTLAANRRDVDETNNDTADPSSRLRDDGIGARIEIEVDGQIQIREVRSGGSYLSHHDLRLHFGLGARDRVDAVRVSWPSGRIEDFGPREADRFDTLVEGAGTLVP